MTHVPAPFQAWGFSSGAKRALKTRLREKKLTLRSQEVKGHLSEEQNFVGWAEPVKRVLNTHTHTQEADTLSQDGLDIKFLLLWSFLAVLVCLKDG